MELQVGWSRWVALHTAYEKNRLFVDEQIDGPFARWIHRHEFEAAEASAGAWLPGESAGASH